MKKNCFLSIILLFPFLSSAADYYWVGGSGNWSDISHWAAASGGSVTYSQAPSSDDNVIFDANSFFGPNQVVTVNTDIAFFRDMSWLGVTNNPTFEAPSTATLNVFGDMILVTNMNFEFMGETRFLGDVMNSNINYAGHNAGLNVVFEGSGGWILNSPIAIDSSLSIRSGNLNTNSQGVNCRYLYFEGTGVKNVSLANSTITLTGGFRDDPNVDYNWEYERKSLYANIENLSLDAGTSRIVFTAKDPGFWIIGDGSVAFHDVIFSSASGDARISRMYYTSEIDFNEVTILSSAKVLSQIDAQTLNLSGGNVYEFLAGETFNFGTINANGNCASGVTITSTENSASATFNVSAGNVDVSFLTLRDIHGSGGASFTASNGVDLGNNLGWNFTNTANLDFYWIGGQGNWSDPNHWSYTSGGAPSGCVPSGKDNVFFDVNSFSAANQAVIIDKPNVYMHDMTWNGVTNNGELKGDEDFRIRITGSLEFDANMNHSFEGYYHFETSETGQTIETNGIIFNRELFFSGVTGEWTFLDDVEIVWRLNFLSGNLITNGKKLTTMGFVSQVVGSRNLNIEGSHIFLRPIMYYEPYWQIEYDGYQVQASNSKIEFSSHSGSFGHYGHSDLTTPSYDTVTYSTNESYLNSTNWFTDEDVPSIIVDHLIYRGNGFIEGSSHFKKLELAGGHYYIFDGNENRAQLIDEIVNGSDCASGLTQLLSNIRSQASTIRIDQDYNLDRMDITDINFSGGIVNANNSIDGGNNTNATFIESGSRTLYWVGDGGFWQEPVHWSLTSGGPGGECIPTSIDDVIFDVNSFSMPNQEVDSYGTQYRNCHDITWTGTTNDPAFVNWYVNPTGSLTYDNSFRNYTWRTVFNGNELQTVTTGGQMFNWIEIKNLGEVEFVDDLSLYQISQYSGSYFFKNINVSTDRMYFEYDIPKVAKFGSSRITINGEGDFNNPPFTNYTGFLTIEPGTSVIDFTGFDTGFKDFSESKFHNAIYSNPQAIGRMINREVWEDDNNQRTNSFNNVTFSSDGETYGNFKADTLIGAAGKTYVINGDRNFDVDSYLQMIGNNCTPIELRSSQPGSKATIEMPSSGTVVADFVQMQDIRGTGGADFNAGSRSTDIGNSNIGWTFEDTPDFIEAGFLGTDRALCTGEDLELNAYSFSPNEIYSWNDGSSDSLLTVDMPGVYFVEVQFESSCILRDTIEIFTALDVMAMLPTSEIICEGTDLILDATVPIATATYTWNDGTTGSTLTVMNDGDYTVEIDLDGCLSTATSNVSVTVNPGLDLGGDRSFCDGDPFNLGTDVIATNYVWQDGITDANIASTIDGLYWLEIEFDNCTFRDSALITYTPRPVAEIGNDTTICSNEMLTLNLANPNGHAVTWQDGSANNSISVMSEGPYVAILDDNGCADKDSIFVTFQEAPLLDLGQDIEECEGAQIDLISNVPADSYLWSSGENTDGINILPIGVTTFGLTITDNECTVSDEVIITINDYPIVDLGAANQETCDNEQLILDAGADGIWQDGSLSQSFEVLNDGVYAVTVSNKGCETTEMVTITVLPSPQFDLGPDIFECEGTEVVLTVPNSSLNFEWEDGSMDIDRVLANSGLYILQVEENACLTRDTIAATFQALPIISLGQDTTVCDDIPFVLIPQTQSSGVLRWEDGSMGTSFLVESPGLINVSLTEGLCEASDAIQVSFKECINFDIFVPNAFSPNQDGINDQLEIFFSKGLVIESYDISVFDRWGNRVFTGKSLDEPWDGRFNTQTLDTGVYAYFINVSYIDDFGPGEKLIRGDVTVLN